MPLLKPEAGESRDDFIGRCMGNDAMLAEFPDNAQRAAVCNAQWRREHAQAEDEQAAQALTAAGYEQRNGAWVKAFAAMKTVTVPGVEIFAVGKHNGDPYSADDIDGIVDASKSLKGRVDAPVKLGHTSDEFNKAISKKMHIPQELIHGENGNGALAFGWCDNLRREGKLLKADFVGVPEPVADLIKSGLYKKVSCEIAIDFKDRGNNYPFVLTGVALLGAELPAVRDIEGLEAAAMYTQQPMEGIRVVEFQAEPEGEPIQDFEYLIHHIETDENGKETIHHCQLYDHIANMFNQAHLWVENGKAYLEGKPIKEGVYHVITGLAEQEVCWSDADARAAGIKPKRMAPGMTLRKKAGEW